MKPLLQIHCIHSSLFKCQNRNGNHKGKIAELLSEHLGPVHGLAWKTGKGMNVSNNFIAEDENQGRRNHDHFLLLSQYYAHYLLTVKPHFPL